MTEVKILVTLEQQELAGRGHEGAFWGMGNVPYVDLVTQKSIYIHSHINVNCTLNYLYSLLHIRYNSMEIFNN